MALMQTEGLLKALTEVEMPLVHVLQQMEAVGIAVAINIFEKHRVRFWPMAPQLISTVARAYVYTRSDRHRPGHMTPR